MRYYIHTHTNNQANIIQKLNKHSISNTIINEKKILIEHSSNKKNIQKVNKYITKYNLAVSNASVLNGNFSPKLKYDFTKSLKHKSKNANKHAKTNVTPPTRISRFFSRAYNFPTYNTTNTNAPVIAIISLGGTFLTSDLQTYWTACGNSGSAPSVTIVNVGTTNRANAPLGSVGSNNYESSIENTLDLELAMTLCPKANIRMYFGLNTTAGFLNAFQQAVTDLSNMSSNVCKVISCSWGASEQAFDFPSLIQYDTVFKTAYNAGITICVASGDNGSSDGNSCLSLDFPSSSPYVVSCGGSSLVNSSAGSSNGETAWSFNTRYDWGGGGGCSNYFERPSYQSGLSIGNTAYPSSMKNSATCLANSARLSPDIAMNADPSYPWDIYFNGAYIGVGGTSAVAPSMSALIALYNKGSSNYNTATTSVLYKLYNQPSKFNTITSGTNDSISTGGYYVAQTGYNMCTGLGTINGSLLSL